MTTFKVSDVEPQQLYTSGGAVDSTPFIGYISTYERRVLSKNPIRASDPIPKAQAQFCEDNGFVDAVVTAYNKHHNLILRPDDVWLAIAVQFGLFVTGNAEDVRHHFVAHEGQKHLEVEASGTLKTADYETILSEAFLSRIKDNVTDPEICDWILPAFSTTTTNDRVTGSIVLMASMKKYFTYGCVLSCGIPNVTLEGTSEDWQKIHTRIAKLRGYGNKCNEWANMLEKITQEMLNSSQGEINTDFWQKICHYNAGGSGPSYLSGWITAFCVWDDKGCWQGDKTAIKRIEGGGFPIIDAACIPSGYLHAPLKIDDNGVKHECVLFAGHGSYVGILGQQTPNVIDTIQPRLSWALYETKNRDNNI